MTDSAHAQSIAFDRAAGFYDQTRGFPPGVEQPAVETIAAAGNLTASSRVLEVGVGTGRIALPLAARVGSLIGVDISIPMMQRLREKRTNEPLYPVASDATRLPFATHSFDAVVAVHIFHLIPNWRGVLAEITRVLKSGAPLILGWNGSSHRLFPREVWAAARVERAAQPNAIDFSRRQTFLVDEGWTPRSDERRYAYSYPKSPQMEVDEVKNRVWSHTWSLSDEELNESVSKLQAYLDANFPDPQQPVPLEDVFHAQAFLPPGHA